LSWERTCNSSNKTWEMEILFSDYYDPFVLITSYFSKRFLDVECDVYLRRNVLVVFLCECNCVHAFVYLFFTKKIMDPFLFILWIYLPAFVANSVPVLVSGIPGICHWTQPIHEKIFGKNKTWRGLLCGVGAAMVVSALFVPAFESIPQKLLWGFLLGFGALGGDLIESFIKRRIGLAPGKALPFFDGVDYMVGGIAFGLFLFIPEGVFIVFLLLVGPILSLLANIIAYFLGLKNVWY